MQCGFKMCNDVAVKEVCVYIPFFGVVYTECKLHSDFTFLGLLGRWEADLNVVNQKKNTEL